MKIFDTFFFFLFLNLGPTLSIYSFSLRENSWKSVTTMWGKRLQFGAAVVDRKLIIAGGRDGLKTLNTVECFDFSTRNWSTLPSMIVHRHGLGIINLLLWHRIRIGI